MVKNKVDPDVPALNRNVAWSFKPIFFWMRIFGIELYDRCFRFRKAINLYGLLVLLTCQWANVDFIVIKFWKISFPFTETNKALNISTSTTLSWNARIDAANNFCFIAIVYPAFFYVAQNRWLRLWNVVETFDFAYCRIDYTKLRRTLLIGFFPILAEISIIIYNLLVLVPNFSNESKYRKFVTVTAFFSKIVPISVLVLYCSVVWLTSLFYEGIRQDVDNTCKLNQENIRKWKGSLALASEVVERLNETYGLILLISIAHYFVEFIARSFYIANSISMTNQPDGVTVMSVSSEVIFLWFMFYSPSRIQYHASKVASSLRKIDTTDIQLQNQVSLLELSIVQNLPKLSAISYFDVNLHLIPQLIGTTLTYLFILYQFHSSEKGE
ncbi:hypothetical protein GHT06_010279 [Daphnia sinensis]|uniref:Gustatory receptor n=1 Tax=Daphnia sinensis TaxID=1820382 RepID=A0AAD5L054_9CRUS|nr:hypothetical protein GHT06_010279 [Daphnia sinensis]